MLTKKNDEHNIFYDLRKIRLSRGLSRREASEQMTGISPSYLADVENGAMPGELRKNELLRWMEGDKKVNADHGSSAILNNGNGNVINGHHVDFHASSEDRQTAMETANTNDERGYIKAIVLDLWGSTKDRQRKVLKMILDLEEN